MQKYFVEHNGKKYLPVMGLEVHIHLNTKTKMFCSCAIEYGEEANKNVCPVCTGQPGVLPVINKKAVELAIKTALALNCKVHNNSIFARKNYYYPDLPKNYQISQYEKPLATDGYVEIEVDGNKKNVLIRRAHLEEDAGKLLHAIGKEELEYSLIDYNRTGTPLLEIVTEPCLFSTEEAVEYLTTLRNILRYISVSDCDMEKGTFRCDANVSVTVIDDEGFTDDEVHCSRCFSPLLNQQRTSTSDGLKPRIQLGTKTELKNMNSFKAIRDALNYEIKRHIEVLSSGQKIVQETRLWNEKLSVTESMRSKEEAHDYRYFPEPDLLPLVITEDWLQKIKSEITELPNKKKQRFKTEYGLSDYDANILISDKQLSDFFDSFMRNVLDKFPLSKIIFGRELTKEIILNKKIEIAKMGCNLIITEMLGLLNKENKNVSESKITPTQVAEIIYFYLTGILSSKLVKELFNEVWNTGKSPEEIVKDKNLIQITDSSELEKIVDEVIKENLQIVNDYKSGKTQAISALIGQAMKKSKGKANPKQLTEIFKSKLT